MKISEELRVCQREQSSAEMARKMVIGHCVLVVALVKSLTA